MKRSNGKAARRWEIEEGQWDRVRDEVHEELRRVARRGDVISYGDLVRKVGHFSGVDSHALAEMLGEINRDEPNYRGDPLLISAVVTHKDDKYPGHESFSAAAHLGKAVPNGDEEQRIFWAKELSLVHKAFSRGGDR
jgi:hypothetical protein